MKIRPIILSGGAGTRLWPNSNKNIPKQFIDWGGWTLFDKTLERIKSTIFDYPIITTNFRYLNFVKRHLAKNRIKKYRIILEPYKKILPLLSYHRFSLTKSPTTNLLFFLLQIIL